MTKREATASPAMATAVAVGEIVALKSSTKTPGKPKGWKKWTRRLSHVFKGKKKSKASKKSPLISQSPDRTKASIRKPSRGSTDSPTGSEKEADRHSTEMRGQAPRSIESRSASEPTDEEWEAEQRRLAHENEEEEDQEYEDEQELEMDGVEYEEEDEDTGSQFEADEAEVEQEEDELQEDVDEYEQLVREMPDVEGESIDMAEVEVEEVEASGGDDYEEYDREREDEGEYAELPTSPLEGGYSEINDADAGVVYDEQQTETIPMSDFEDEGEYEEPPVSPLESDDVNDTDAGGEYNEQEDTALNGDAEDQGEEYQGSPTSPLENLCNEMNGTVDGDYEEQEGKTALVEGDGKKGEYEQPAASPLEASDDDVTGAHADGEYEALSPVGNFEGECDEEPHFDPLESVDDSMIDTDADGVYEELEEETTLVGDAEEEREDPPASPAESVDDEMTDTAVAGRYEERQDGTTIVEGSAHNDGDTDEVGYDHDEPQSDEDCPVNMEAETASIAESEDSITAPSDCLGEEDPTVKGEEQVEADYELHDGDVDGCLDDSEVLILSAGESEPESLSPPCSIEPRACATTPSRLSDVPETLPNNQSLLESIPSHMTLLYDIVVLSCDPTTPTSSDSRLLMASLTHGNWTLAELVAEKLQRDWKHKMDACCRTSAVSTEVLLVSILNHCAA